MYLSCLDVCVEYDPMILVDIGWDHQARAFAFDDLFLKLFQAFGLKHDGGGSLLTTLLLTTLRSALLSFFGGSVGHEILCEVNPSDPKVLYMGGAG